VTRSQRICACQKPILTEIMLLPSRSDGAGPYSAKTRDALSSQFWESAAMS
jgi:hypothetical protein